MEKMSRRIQCSSVLCKNCCPPALMHNKWVGVWMFCRNPQKVESLLMPKVSAAPFRRMQQRQFLGPNFTDTEWVWRANMVCVWDEVTARSITKNQAQCGLSHWHPPLFLLPCTRCKRGQEGHPSCHFTACFGFFSLLGITAGFCFWAFWEGIITLSLPDRF